MTGGPNRAPNGRSGAAARRPRIVVFAYSCRPGGGSEAGAGWMWARLLANIGDVWLVTVGGSPDDPLIREALTQVPEGAHITQVAVPMPVRLERLLRVLRFPGRAHVHYMLWQFVALRTLETRPHPSFDVAWHLTWSTGWLGAVAWRLSENFVYGPIAGGVGTPWRLALTIGPSGVAVEVLRAGARWMGRHLNPLARRSIARARLILLQNDDTLRWIPAEARARAIVFPHIVLDPLPVARRGPPVHARPVALFAGRVELWKGPHLAMEAIAGLPEWDLVICGEGSAVPALRRLARRLGCADRVEFRGPIPRDQLLRVMRDEADVFVFPSFRDEGGWVVSEAVAIGLPVVCLDRGGPPTLGGIGVRASGRAATVARLRDAIQAAAEGSLRAHPVAPVDFDSRLGALRSLLIERGVIELQDVP